MYVGRRTGALDTGGLCVTIGFCVEVGRGEDPALREGIEEIGEGGVGVESAPMPSTTVASFGVMMVAESRCFFWFQPRGAAAAAAGCVEAAGACVEGADENRARDPIGSRAFVPPTAPAGFAPTGFVFSTVPADEPSGVEWEAMAPAPATTLAALGLILDPPTGPGARRAWQGANIILSKRKPQKNAYRVCRSSGLGFCDRSCGDHRSRRG